MLMLMFYPLLATGGTIAQGNVPLDSIMSRETNSVDSTVHNPKLDKTVEVSKAYRPSLPKEEKQTFAPSLVDSVRSSRPPFEYTLISRPMLHDANLRPIPAAKLGREKEEEYRKFYLKLGFGDYISPMGVFLYSQPINKYLSLGGTIRHRSAFGKIKFPDGGRTAAPYSRTAFNFHAQGVLRQVQLEGDLGYHHDLSSFYGRVDTLTLPWNPYHGKKSNAHSVRMNFAVKDLTTEHKAWHYDGRFLLKSYHDNWRANEVYTLVGGNVSKGLGDHYALGAGMRLEHWSLKLGEGGTQGHTLFSLTPYGEWFNNRWQIKGGVDLTLGNNRGKFEFGLYPKAYFGYVAVEDYVVPFLEADGGMDGNGYGALREENRWIRPNCWGWSSSRKLEIRGGVRGAAKKIGLSYRGWVGFTLEDSAVMYVNSASAYRDESGTLRDFYTSTFEIEQANVQVIRAQVEMGYHLRQRYNFGLRVDYQGYRREGNIPVWHRPKVEAALTGEFNLREKIVVGMDFYLEGGAKARGLKGESIALPMLYDLNLYGRYRFADWAGIFIDLRNIAFCNYSRYYLYPQHRFNMHLGVIFRF